MRRLSTTRFGDVAFLAGGLSLAILMAPGFAQDPPTDPPPPVGELTLEQPVDPVPTPTEGLETVTTESGLKYIDIKVGEGEQPKPGAIVKVHYSGWLENGTLFDSSVKKGQPFTTSLNDVVKGWTEGVGSMKVGGKRKLIVPAELGYGPTARPKIPANSTLIFEVDLLEVVTQPPEQTSCEGLEEHSQQYVMKYWDLTAGTGQSPQPDATVTMHYSLWLKDGTLLDSSAMRGQPVTTPLAGRLFAGWAEGMLTMKAGGKRRLEIPPPLAFGRAGIPPRVPPDTTIIVECELIDVKNPGAPPQDATEEVTEEGTEEGTAPDPEK